jgi:hypothetical protein
MATIGNGGSRSTGNIGMMMPFVQKLNVTPSIFFRLNLILSDFYRHKFFKGVIRFLCAFAQSRSANMPICAIRVLT